MHPVDRKEADMLLRMTSKSCNSLFVESQHKILMLKNELKARAQPILSNFTSAISVLPALGNHLKFEVSLEAPCVSNLVAKNKLRSSPRPWQKSKSPQTSKLAKERFKIKKCHSMFSMFRDTKQYGRKEKIKY